MRFGISTCDITPPFPTTMGGYARRGDLFDRVNDPLLFSAVVLEQDGRKVLLAAADLVNWPNDGRTEKLIEQLADLLQTDAAGIMLNASHTHGGPKIPGVGLNSRGYGNVHLAERYADWLAEQVVQTVRQADASLARGTLHYVQGQTDLPISRRCLRDGRIEHAPSPDAPTDQAMDLLVIKDHRQAVRAVIMRLSCHPVATGMQHALTADYVGAWRRAFTQAWGSSAVPVFLQGAGGDLRPRHTAQGGHWRNLRHDELPAIGWQLHAQMLAALCGSSMQAIDDPLLLARQQQVQVPCEPRYTTAEQVGPLLNSQSPCEQQFARACLARLEQGQPIPRSATFCAQTLWLSSEIALVGLDVEPLVGLGRAIEQAFSPRKAIVLGYTNGCRAYAPDSVELARGGYEADSYLYEPWSGPYATGCEQSIIPALWTSPPASVPVQTAGLAHGRHGSL